MKIIMPIARLAAVKVSQVLGEPTRGIVTSASATGSRIGAMSRFGFGSGSVAVSSVTDVPPG